MFLAFSNWMTPSPTKYRTSIEVTKHKTVDLFEVYKSGKKNFVIENIIICHEK